MSRLRQNEPTCGATVTTSGQMLSGRVANTGDCATSRIKMADQFHLSRKFFSKSKQTKKQEQPKQLPTAWPTKQLHYNKTNSTSSSLLFGSNDEMRRRISLDCDRDQSNRRLVESESETTLTQSMLETGARNGNGQFDSFADETMAKRAYDDGGQSESGQIEAAQQATGEQFASNNQAPPPVVGATTAAVKLNCSQTSPHSCCSSCSSSNFSGSQSVSAVDSKLTTGRVVLLAKQRDSAKTRADGAPDERGIEAAEEGGGAASRDEARRGCRGRGSGSSSGTNALATKLEPSADKKLRTTSRAVLLLRRAAATLANARPQQSTANRNTLPNALQQTQGQEDYDEDEEEEGAKVQEAPATRKGGGRNSLVARLARPIKSVAARATTAAKLQPSDLDTFCAGDDAKNDFIRRRSPSASTDPNAIGSGGENGTGITSLPSFIVPRTNALKLPYVCLIKSLDGQLMREVFVHRYELGQYLIDSLKVSLQIVDSKYFGLKIARCIDDQDDVRQPWLDLNESVCKQIGKFEKLPLTSGSKRTQQQQQLLNDNNGITSESNPLMSTPRKNHSIKGAKSVDFYLRIKFYPPNLARLQDPFVKEYLWLQLRRDLRLGKLTSSMNNLTYLMACVLQYELGNHQTDLIEHIPQFNILPNQDLVEEQAIELWRNKLTGLKRHQVQMQFLRACVIMETYGFDYYPARDHQRQRAYLLGFNYAGVKTIRNGRIVHHFRWHNISKISHERRMIIFHIYPTETSKRKQILGFKCLSNEDCQVLYMRLLEQKYFFTVDLAYFDQSVHRPSCLEPSQSAMLLDDEWQRHEQLPDGFEMAERELLEATRRQSVDATIPEGTNGIQQITTRNSNDEQGSRSLDLNDTPRTIWPPNSITRWTQQNVDDEELRAFCSDETGNYRWPTSQANAINQINQLTGANEQHANFELNGRVNLPKSTIPRTSSQEQCLECRQACQTPISCNAADYGLNWKDRMSVIPLAGKKAKQRIFGAIKSSSADGGGCVQHESCRTLGEDEPSAETSFAHKLAIRREPTLVYRPISSNNCPRRQYSATSQVSGEGSADCETCQLHRSTTSSTEATPRSALQYADSRNNDRQSPVLSDRRHQLQTVNYPIGSSELVPNLSDPSGCDIGSVRDKLLESKMGQCTKANTMSRTITTTGIVVRRLSEFFSSVAAQVLPPTQITNVTRPNLHTNTPKIADWVHNMNNPNEEQPKENNNNDNDNNNDTTSEQPIANITNVHLEHTSYLWLVARLSIVIVFISLALRLSELISSCLINWLSFSDREPNVPGTSTSTTSNVAIAGGKGPNSGWRTMLSTANLYDAG